MQKFETVLQAGSCALADPENARTVQETLIKFHQLKYDLYAWCVMPNHVHVVIEPTNVSLPQCLHSIKSYTVTAINKKLGRSGPFWEKESFDHLIRTVSDLHWFCRYCEQNPVNAGLCKKPADHPFNNVGASWKESSLESWVDPRTTPFVEIRSRSKLPHLEKPLGVYFVTWRQFD